MTTSRKSICSNVDIQNTSRSHHQLRSTGSAYSVDFLSALDSAKFVFRRRLYASLDRSKEVMLSVGKSESLMIEGFRR